ncbi:hypothetical protein GOP47_0001901 [Adiantum capillus-veneris]|uniref:Uncharacterized protein n=1 Tax=Adiantum capillus-veneris TaxID=13818 RepID=A0A9D4VAM1_ADICA|nr:hypothetical protein GOP47_0001901 [Adiantum capillus-veneris]
MAPVSQLTIWRRAGNTNARLSKRLSAFTPKKAPVFSSSFLSDLSANAGLLKLKNAAMEVKESSAHGGALASTCAISASPETLRWIFTGAATLLMLIRNTAIRKQFLVPLLALQAPMELITWMRGEYGLWAAFLALLVRLFYHIPGELELPLALLLLVITAPYQVMDLRETVGAVVACAFVAAFLAYQHFSGAGGMRGSFKEGTILASMAVICLVGVPFAFLLAKF